MVTYVISVISDVIIDVISEYFSNGVVSFLLQAAKCSFIAFKALMPADGGSCCNA